MEDIYCNLGCSSWNYTNKFILFSSVSWSFLYFKFDYNSLSWINSWFWDISNNSIIINFLPEFLATSYGWIISLMNAFVSWVSNQEAFLIKNISFSLAQVLISYLIITALIIWVKNKTYKNLAFLFIAILLSQSYFIYEKYNASSYEFIVFHKSRHSIIGFKNNRELLLHHNLNDIGNEKLITNYKVGEQIKKTIIDSIQDFYITNKRMILVIDSLNVYNPKTIKPDILLLRNSPKINLKREIVLILKWVLVR